MPDNGNSEMKGGSSASYLACAACVPLICTWLNWGGNRRAFGLQGQGGDHFHCTVEPSPGYIRFRCLASRLRVNLCLSRNGLGTQVVNFCECNGTWVGSAALVIACFVLLGFGLVAVAEASLAGCARLGTHKGGALH